ncbi:EF-hand domain-containing protein [Microbaculum sp. FT89]|uniref:EF-hand domain-containing protein n=1 Tax=Microbaculum sp. FT89 TaxID=3447298 RepID=UPI003F52FA50
MKTSTTLLVAAGAVLAVIGVGSAVYADSGWRGHGFGPCRDGGMRGMMHGEHGPMGDRFGGHFSGQMGGMTGPMVAKRMFELADTDKDGKLTQAEIDAARTQRFETYDTNGDGKLSLTEFGALFSEITEPATVRAFQFLDPDGDAEITKEEFDKPGTRLVERFDRNGDGVLSRDDRPHGFDRVRGGHGGYGPKDGMRRGPQQGTDN